MLHVVCQVQATEGKVSLTWSEGPSFFDPYHLTGDAADDFRDYAEDARDCLREVVSAVTRGADADVRPACYRLARVGHDLFKQIFLPDGEQPLRVAREVHDWLGRLRDNGHVRSLEVVMDQPWSIPWNTVYDEKPDQAAFLEG